MDRSFYHLWTGSGSDRIDLEFREDRADIRAQSLWMGVGERRSALACRHRPLSEDYEILVVEAIEAASGQGTALEPVLLDPEEVLLPITIEYLRIAGAPVYLHEESQLVAMKPLGYADWNERFRVVRLIHDFEWRAETSPLKEICAMLDKKKLDRVATE